MKDGLLFFAIALVCLILYAHKLNNDEVKQRLDWVEAVVFDSARCPKE